MIISKSSLFTGLMSDCYEFKFVENFKLLPAISPIAEIDYTLKIIGSAITLRNRHIVNERINILHYYCDKSNLTFSVEELENGEWCITIDEINYIINSSYLRIICPVEYVYNNEIKECWVYETD